MAEEAPFGAAVGVIVIRNVPHVIVDVELPELSGSDFSNSIMHVCEMFWRWFSSVKAPHHHRNRADLTFRRFRRSLETTQ